MKKRFRFQSTADSLTHHRVLIQLLCSHIFCAQVPHFASSGRGRFAASVHLPRGEYFRTVIPVSLLGCHSFVKGTLFTRRRVLGLVLTSTRLIWPIQQGRMTGPFQTQPEKLSQTPVLHRLMQGLQVAGGISGTARSHCWAYSQLFSDKTQQPSVNSGRRLRILSSQTTQT